MAERARPPSSPGRAQLSRRLLLVALAAGATVAGACTGADPPSGARPAPEPADASAPGATSRPPGTPAPSPAPDAGASPTLADLETRWAEARAAVVASLSRPEYGVGDDGVLRGPGGFEIDLGSCPAGWSDTAGLDASTIRLAHTTALTGAVSASARLTDGLRAYIDQVNANGGVAGRQIELTVLDDGFEPARTMGHLDGLLDDDPTDPPPLAVNTLGSPASLAVYGTLNDNCVPHPFVVSNHPAWGDPAGHPWTIGLQLTPTTEAALWGAWIEQALGGELPVRVAALVMDNETGSLWADAFAAWADQHPDVIAAFEPVTHSPSASSVSGEMAAIAATSPDVFIAMTAGRPCAQAVQDAAVPGATVMARFVASVCRDPAVFMAPAGADSDGWRIVGDGVKSPADTRWTDDAFMAFTAERLRAAGLDPADTLAVSGFGLFGWAQVEALRIAAELPGGLSRSNLVLALRGLDLAHPLLVDGVAFTTDGNRDAYPLEGAEILVYDSATGGWKPDGEPIDLDATTPPCTWNGSGC